MNPVDTVLTRASLLQRLKRWEDHQSWADFDETYRGLIRKFALKAGLADADADEVVQETMTTIARHIAEFEYDRSRCRFKTWLINLTRWRIVDQLRRHQMESRHLLEGNDGGDSPERHEDFEGPGAAEFERLWREELEAHLLRSAMTKVRRRVDPKQYQMFHLAVHGGTDTSEIARRLGVSMMQVYLARHRVGKMVAREVRRLREEEG